MARDGIATRGSGREPTGEKHLHAGEPGADSIKLTAREEQILACFEAGMLYKEILARLGISYSLLRKLQHRLFKKLHAANHAEAVQHWHRAKTWS